MEEKTMEILEKNPIPVKPHRTSKVKLAIVSSIATGIQFGWALQLALLTPYIQLLGIPHKFASYMWLCGPISGLLVQPTVGYYSDRCTSRWGRRTPFIAVGAVLVVVAVFLIGFAADIGHAAGDRIGNVVKPRAIVVFMVGFWVLDVANNTLQGPCRALLADLANGCHARTRIANSYFSFFMALGNVAGYAAGAWRGLHKIFPFTLTNACDMYCANLKSCFIISAILLIFFTILALIFVRETQFSRQEIQISRKCSKIPFIGQFSSAIKTLPRSMWLLLLVTCFNWIAWFPFTLFDTDWMGKEVYGGEADGEGKDLYTEGVNMGAWGLMINSIVLGFMSFGMEFFTRVLGDAKRLWGVVNVLLGVCLGMTVLVTKSAKYYRGSHRVGWSGSPPPPPTAVKYGALGIFAFLGIPMAITFSTPFAMASIFSASSDSGQGLSLGVLNLAIVIPQIFVSLTSGPWDSLFEGGNLPAFLAGAVAAFISAILCFTVLPSPQPQAQAQAQAQMGGSRIDDH